MAKSDPPRGTGHPVNPDQHQHGLRRRMGSEARRISSQHEQLDTFFSLVTAAVERGSLHAARPAFTRFADALDSHFTLEDRVFFPALRGLDPQLTKDLTGLADEHHALRRDLESLTDLLAAGSLESFAVRLETLGDTINGHEAREELILASVRKPGGPAPA